MRLIELFGPSIILYHAIKSYVSILIQSVCAGRIPPNLRSRAFTNFWAEVFGNQFDPTQAVEGPSALVPPLLSQASGNVLEIGPGCGTTTFGYEAAAPQIKAIYGVEPALELHQYLRRNADATKVGSKYKILSADASKASILNVLAETKSDVLSSPTQTEGIFDTIVCIRVLCSMPDQRQTISDIHSLLKPGGKLLILEHTVNPWRTPKGSIAARVVQSLFMLFGWGYFIGGCSLTRDTEAELRREKENRWETVEFERHYGQDVLTHLSGTLVKKTE